MERNEQRMIDPRLYHERVMEFNRGPLEDRASYTDSYLMERSEAYELAKNRLGNNKDELRKYRRLLLGNRFQRTWRWFKGLFTYLKIDWREKK